MATSFILSTPNTGIIPFSASTSVGASSPKSEDSTSSYEDGPAENGRRDTSCPSIEHRMYVINRNGSGEASYLLLTEDAKAILSYRVHSEKWKPIEGVLHFGVVVLDSWIYVIGGLDKNLATTLKRMIRYDPREGQWVACKDMIQARSRFGACVVNGKIWVCGGERSDGKITASCEVYDPEVNEWSKCGMLLAPRASPACVGYGSDLLCAGGFYNGSAQNNLWLYEDHRWQELDEHYPHRLPYCLDKCAVAAHQNTFYFLGGVTTISPHDKSSNKSKDAQKASHIPSSMPTGTSVTTTTTTNNNSNKTNGILHNNSNSSVNRTTSNRNNSHHHHQHQPHQLQLKPNSNSKNKNEKQQQQHQHQQPNERPRFVTERRMFSFTTSILAGERKQQSAQLDLISPWNFKLPPLIHARHSAGAVAIGSKVYVVGGTSVETGQPIKMSEHFNLVTGQWEEDFTLRRCDVSNVCCVVVGVPNVPFQDRKSVVRLRWVMW